MISRLLSNHLACDTYDDTHSSTSDNDNDFTFPVYQKGTHTHTHTLCEEDTFEADWKIAVDSLLCVLFVKTQCMAFVDVIS